MTLDELLYLLAICLLSLIVIIGLPWPEPSHDDMWYIISGIIELFKGQ